MTDLQNSKSVSRRQALAGAVAATFVGPVAVAAAMPSTENPDAALLAAWEGYRAINKQYEAINDELRTPEQSDDDADWFFDAISPHERILLDVPAKTIHGLSVRLAYLCSEKSGRLSTYGAMFLGTEIPDDLLVNASYTDILTYEIAKNVRALAV